MSNDHQTLDLGRWLQKRQSLIQEVRKLNDEECFVLGRIEKLNDRLLELRKNRDGFDFSIAAGDEVAKMAQEEFHKIQHENQKNEKASQEETK